MLLQFTYQFQDPIIALKYDKKAAKSLRLFLFVSNFKDEQTDQYLV